MGEKTSRETPKVLRERLELKRKEIDLILAIDRIRDTVPEPSAMLAGIANVLIDQLQADLCLLCLLDRETAEVELKAINDRGEQLARLGSAAIQELVERAVEADDVALWEGSKVLPESDLARLPGSLQLVAVPIIMGAEERLGALLLALTWAWLVTLLFLRKSDQRSKVLSPRLSELSFATLFGPG